MIYKLQLCAILYDVVILINPRAVIFLMYAKLADVINCRVSLRAMKTITTTPAPLYMRICKRTEFFFFFRAREISGYENLPRRLADDEKKKEAARK